MSALQAAHAVQLVIKVACMPPPFSSWHRLSPDAAHSPVALCPPAVLFNIVPQLFDIVAACIFISAALEPWIAVIVFITLGSYIPVTIVLTEWRVKFRRCHSLRT